MAFPRFAYMQWAKHTGRQTTYRLSESELPCPTPAAFGLTAPLVDLSQLPFDDPATLGHLIARRDRVDPRNVILCCGASHGLYIAVGALCEPGDQVIVESPAYPPLELVPRSFGADVRPLPRDPETHQVPLERLEEMLASRPRLLLLTNLHNPTGALIPFEQMVDLASIAARSGTTVIVDEVYREFVDDLPTAARAGDNVVIVSSVTKAYGLGGLRAGWIIGSRDILDRIVAFNDLVAVNPPAPSIRLAAAALADDRFTNHCRREARRVRMPRLAQVIEAAPCLRWERPAGGLVGFPQVVGVRDAKPLVDFLAREYDVQVVPGRFFGAPAHIRVGCGGPLEELDEALSRLAGGLAAWPRTHSSPGH